jgi:hypothetical protein
VKYIIEHQSADLENIIRYQFREHQSNPGKDEQWHPEIHHNDIGKFLERVEFLIFRDGKRMFLISEDPYRVKDKLLPEIGSKVLPPFPVKSPITGHNVPDHKDPVIEGDNNGCHIMDANCNIKRDDIIICIAEMKHNACENKQQEHQSIDYMPDPDPDRIEVNLCGCHIICFSA